MNMNKALIYGLLLSILMVIAPHADHLPWWSTALTTVVLGWRGLLAWQQRPLRERLMERAAMLLSSQL